MPITQRPKSTSKASPDVDVEALISKGGSVGNDHAMREAERKEGKEEKPAVSVILRIPPVLLQRINRVLAARSLKTPRHTWLLEAVLEKLDREEEAES